MIGQGYLLLITAENLNYYCLWGMKMSIIENQVLEFQNVLSFRGKITQQELENKPQEMGEIIIQNGATKIGPYLLATHGVEPGLLSLLLDVELLIPIDRLFEPPEEYAILDFFCLNDALKITHKGPQTSIESTLNELSQYISGHHLVPTSPVYSVLQENAFLSFGTVAMEVDLYVSVKSNKEKT